MEYKNYCPVDKFSVRYKHFCFADTKDHIAAELFKEHGIKVLFHKQYAKEESDYVFVFVKVLKKDLEKFYEVLEEIKTKMETQGKTEYREVCESFFKDK